jgi:hypothetical protein
MAAAAGGAGEAERLLCGHSRGRRESGNAGLVPGTASMSSISVWGRVGGGARPDQSTPPGPAVSEHCSPQVGHLLLSWP